METMEQQILERLVRMEDKIEKILIQTTKTNGRVDALEEKTDNHNSKLHTLIDTGNVIKGRDKVVWILVSAVSTVALILFGWYLNKN